MNTPPLYNQSNSAELRQKNLHNKSSIDSLYVLKAFCAFAVVQCHCPFLLDWIHLPGLSVQLFFIITGYFLYNQDTSVVQRHIRKSLKKLIPLIIALNVIYYPVSHITASIQESPVEYIRWLILGIPTYSVIHLWYLSAVLYGLICLSLFLKLFGNKYIPLLFPLPLVGLFMSGYRYFLDGQPESGLIFNFLTQGLPYLAMGYYIKMHEEKLLQCKRWIEIYIVLILVKMLENLTVSYLSHGNTDGGIIGLTLIPTLFIICLSYKNFGKGSTLVTIGKEYSGNIYYFHMMIIAGFTFLAKKSPLIQYLYDQGATAIVFFISLAIAYCVSKIQKRIGYTLLP